MYLDIKVTVKALDEDDEGTRQVVPRRGLDGLARILRSCANQETLQRWHHHYNTVATKVWCNYHQWHASSTPGQICVPRSPKWKEQLMSHLRWWCTDMKQSRCFQLIVRIPEVVNDLPLCWFDCLSVSRITHKCEALANMCLTQQITAPFLFYLHER